MTIARASTVVDTEKRYPAGIDTAKARAASGWREIALSTYLEVLDARRNFRAEEPGKEP